MLICSYLMAVWLCIQPTPIICNQTYEKEIKTAVFSAYTLSEDETDGSPTIAAWGDDLSKYKGCVVASRLYHRGTEIYITGVGRCKVLDKTSKKYSERIDILFKDKKSAMKFGLKTLNYRVIN